MRTRERWRWQRQGRLRVQFQRSQDLGINRLTSWCGVREKEGFGWPCGILAWVVISSLMGLGHSREFRTGINHTSGANPKVLIESKQGHVQTEAKTSVK